MTKNGTRVQLNGEKLWREQPEEDSDEGELPEGAMGEKEPSDDEEDEAEQSVNGKPNKMQEKTGGNEGKDIELTNDGADGDIKLTEFRGIHKIPTNNPYGALPPAEPNINKGDIIRKGDEVDAGETVKDTGMQNVNMQSNNAANKEKQVHVEKAEMNSNLSILVKKQNQEGKNEILTLVATKIIIADPMEKKGR